MKRLIALLGAALTGASAVLLVADATAAGALAAAGAAGCLAIVATVTWRIDEDEVPTRSSPTVPTPR